RGCGARLEFFCFQTLKHKCVERLLDPGATSDVGFLGTDRRRKGPVLGVLAALSDPALQDSDLLYGQTSIRRGRRHPHSFLLRGDALVDRAGFRLAWNQGGAAAASMWRLRTNPGAGLPFAYCCLVHGSGS